MSNYPQCHHTHVIKHGKLLHKQCFRCKSCLFTFIEQDTRTYTESMRHFTIYLYLQGQSLRSVAKTLMASPASIMLWIRDVGEAVMKRKSPKRFIAEVDINETRHYFEKKTQKYWRWLAWDRKNKCCLGVELGRLNVETGNKLWKQLNLC